MGYETEFRGYLKLSKPLTDEQQRWFNDWSDIRKQHYDSEKLSNYYNGVGSLDGEYGINGEFFGYIPTEVRELYEEIKGWKIMMEWRNGKNPLMFPIEGKQNDPPSNQPSLWCEWKIDGNILHFRDDGGSRKFGYYLEWLEYIRINILSKWGIQFEEGYSIDWRGDDFEDVGRVSYDDEGNQIVNYLVF
jgi:hypothetical protein